MQELKRDETQSRDRRALTRTPVSNGAGLECGNIKEPFGRSCIPITSPPLSFPSAPSLWKAALGRLRFTIFYTHPYHSLLLFKGSSLHWRKCGSVTWCKAWSLRFLLTEQAALITHYCLHSQHSALRGEWLLTSLCKQASPSFFKQTSPLLVPSEH